jgi:hypothetical protein
MLNRFAILAAVAVLVPVGAATAVSLVAHGTNTVASADDGAMPSAAPGVLTTPDGWTLNVSAQDESLLPVAPLTTALSSREYLVGGTFNGSVRGGGSTKLTGGTLEAGYQIGCGIVADDVELTAIATAVPAVSVPLTAGHIGSSVGVAGGIKINLKPGVVNIVPVDKKSFKGTDPRVTITGFRVKIDGCAGQSFIRSYATLTSSTSDTDDVITYLGVTKAV